MDLVGLFLSFSKEPSVLDIHLLKETERESSGFVECSDRKCFCFCF